MIVAITGATSMIGCAIVDELIYDADIEKIYVVVRKDTSRLDRIQQSSKIAIIWCNIDSYSCLPSLIHDKCDVFYHIAWSATGKNRNDNVVEQINNIKFTLDALYAAKALGCTKFIGAGSQAEYGILNVERISPDSPVNPIQPYGIAKYAAGRLALEEAKRLEICCLWVRIFSVYGIYDKPTTMISSTISKMLNDEYISLTSGEQIWDFLFSSDAGRAFHLIGKMNKSVSKVYCLGSGKARKIIDYVKTMRIITGSNSFLGFGEIKYNKNRIMNLCADISELTKDTGWEPTIAFEEGIKTIYETTKHNRKNNQQAFGF